MFLDVLGSRFLFDVQVEMQSRQLDPRSGVQEGSCGGRERERTSQVLWKGPQTAPQEPRARLVDRWGWLVVPWKSERKGSSLRSSGDPQTEGAGGPHPAGFSPSVQNLSCWRASVAPTPLHCGPPRSPVAAVTAVSLKSDLHKSSA